MSEMVGGLAEYVSHEVRSAVGNRIFSMEISNETVKKRELVSVFGADSSLAGDDRTRATYGHDPNAERRKRRHPKII
jgi:hypothetical protein